MKKDKYEYKKYLVLEICFFLTSNSKMRSGIKATKIKNVKDFSGGQLINRIRPHEIDKMNLLNIPIKIK
tara:strand:+ start:313 stop:519 length:207 start_codon:yes stop_codon:yes gene_type:complete